MPGKKPVPERCMSYDSEGEVYNVDLSGMPNHKSWVKHSLKAQTLHRTDESPAHHPAWEDHLTDLTAAFDLLNDELAIDFGTELSDMRRVELRHSLVYGHTNQTDTLRRLYKKEHNPTYTSL